MAQMHRHLPLLLLAFSCQTPQSFAIERCLPICVYSTPTAPFL